MVFLVRGTSDKRVRYRYDAMIMTRGVSEVVHLKVLTRCLISSGTTRRSNGGDIYMTVSKKVENERS